MKKAEKELYGKIARLGCCLCRHLGYGETPSEIHHIQKNGIPRYQREVIGLCPEHHRGNSGIHGLGKRGFEARYGIDEQALLQKTMELIGLD